MRVFANIYDLRNAHEFSLLTLLRNKLGSMSLGVREIIFISLFLIASIPILTFAVWVERSAVQKEIAAVSEKHLVVAKNMSAAISRYVTDVGIVISLLENYKIQEDQDRSISDQLDSMHIRYVATIGANNQVQSRVLSKSLNLVTLPDVALMTKLRKRAATSKGAFAISGIENYLSTPHFFVVKELSDDRFLLAPLAPTYLNEIQKSIVFGEKGHSMIVDQYGRIVAHPMAKWQAASKDVSKLSVVRQMMAGKTGVMQFYSPPMKADMISGYTFVPESGWGVMVPQPMGELISRARDTQFFALIIAITEILLAFLLSAYLSNLLAKPVSDVVKAAKSVSKGNLNTCIEIQSKYLPVEMKLLSTTFNEMTLELKNNTDLLSNALNKAEEGSRVKSQFMAMMTHEIRTPLSGIIGVMDLMEECDLDEEQKQYVAIAQNLSEGLLEIINSILDYSRLETNKVEVENVPFDVRQLVQEIHNLFDSITKEKNISFIENISAEVPTIIVSDVQRIRQVLFNVVGNAAKFTEEGTVEISVGMTSVDAGRGILKVDVSDTGIGIADDMSRNLFEDYVQCDASHSRQYGGTGLGLAISKRLAELLGGEIWFSSTLGQGSKFSILLPVKIEGESNE
ncbi:MAG: ATP-binding protein [Sneathiella sp.]